MAVPLFESVRCHVQGWPEPYIYWCIQCIYGIFGREITIHTVIHGVCIYGSGQP